MAFGDEPAAMCTAYGAELGARNRWLVNGGTSWAKRGLAGVKRHAMIFPSRELM